MAIIKNGCQRDQNVKAEGRGGTTLATGSAGVVNFSMLSRTPLGVGYFFIFLTGLNLFGNCLMIPADNSSAINFMWLFASSYFLTALV
jgi:hypothetical protein